MLALQSFTLDRSKYIMFLGAKQPPHPRQKKHLGTQPNPKKHVHSFLSADPSTMLNFITHILLTSL